MDRFIVKSKQKSLDKENEGEELENNVTAMNEQPPENQENQEDGHGKRHLANVANVDNVAPVAKRIWSVQEEHSKFH